MMPNEAPAIRLGRHVILTWDQVDAAPLDYPDDLKALGCEIVSNGAGLWAKQNRYNDCPPMTWYPDPRICVALTLSLHGKHGISLGIVHSAPPPARDWATYVERAALSSYFCARPEERYPEDDGKQPALFINQAAVESSPTQIGQERANG